MRSYRGADSLPRALRVSLFTHRCFHLYTKPRGKINLVSDNKTNQDLTHKMKTTSVIQKTRIVCGFFAAIVIAAGSSQAQTVLGSFQGASDPLNAGWTNPNGGNPITSDSASSFVAAGVPSYPYSLDMSAAVKPAILDTRASNFRSARPK